MSSHRTDLAVAVLGPVGQGDAATLAALRAAGIDRIDRITLERPGAWAAARNTALENAAEAGLLALVELDVIVSPGWADSITKRFASDGALALLGGEVRASAKGPGGIDAEAHAQVLGLSSGGRPVSGNAVFRTDALRAVGGFAPIRGHTYSVDPLADWQLALEDLVVAGWTIDQEPTMAGVRDVAGLSVATLLRRRLHTGARAAVLDRDGRSQHAVRDVIRTVGASAARASRRDGAGAVDRLAWAAGKLGSVLGPKLADSELQPDRTSTPWRPSVSGSTTHRVRSGGGGGIVLLYHRVCEPADDSFNVAVSAAVFAEQMTVLTREFIPASLADVVSGAAGSNAVAVTFDDGYADNLRNALPILADAGVPATLFASTGHIATGAGYWWDDLERSLAAATAHGDRGPLTLDLPGGARTWPVNVSTALLPTMLQLRAALVPLSAEAIASAIAQVRRWAGVPDLPPDADRPLTIDELVQLAAAGPFDVQAHGRNHLSMALMDPATRRDEFSRSADDIEGWLGARPTQFAYPFGVYGTDVDAETARDAEQAGYRIAVVNGGGRSGDMHAVARQAVPNLDAAAFSELMKTAVRVGSR